MSGMVECYLINQDGRQCNFSPAVTNTRVIFGKNQPFLGVEITVAKYMFDSDDFWSGQTPSGTTLLTRPELIQNSTPIHIKTYGGEYDLVYTQTLNPDDMTYVLLCYTKMWQSKTTEVSSLISDIVWSGQSGTYDSGTLIITCNGITTNTQIGGVFLPTDGAEVSKNNVQLVKPSRVNVTPPASLASIGTLRVLVPIYQDPTIPTDALVGYTDPTGEVSFEDLEHTMRADTVYASILFEYAGPFSKQDLNNYYKGIFANLIIPQFAYVLHPINKVQQNINGEMVVRSGMQEDGILYCKGVEYVTGYGQTLFAWLSNAIGGYVGTDLVIDKGYKMESSAEILSKLGFDTETLAKYKANDNPPTARTYGDSIYKLVPDTICYDLIKAVSIATNRTAFFADVPYLSSFEVAESEYSNALSELTIQYTPSDSSYCAYFIPLGETEPQQIALGSGVEYNDQGSTYLVGEQTARSANASVTVKATDAGTDIAGMPVEVNIDTASIDSSKEILAQVAFNTLVENYHPSNTLSFIALENTSVPIETTYVAYMTLASGLPDPSPSNNGKYYINAGVADVNLYLSNGTTWTATTPTTGDSVTVHAPSNTYYFVFNGTVWVEYRAYAGVERHALFRPDTRCATLEDTRSHTTLTNVPLAYTVLSWPDCTTRYMFGEPIFQDTEETIADLQAISKQSITNNSVSEALSKPYVTTVIGNMSLDEAGDDLTDFSGLILQRNESTGVASMDGYMGGQRQARFSSDGAISSGVVTYHSPRSSDPTALSEAGDSVVMDRDGFHTRSWHLYSQTSPQFSYADGYWVEETRIGVDGEISAGAGSVVLGHDGLTNYDSDGEPAYTLDDDGLKYKGQPIIDSENGKIQLKVDGAAIDGNLRAISITLPYVQIDNEGLRTFDRYFWDTEKEEYQYWTGDLQCSVGTNGVITAGAGAVKLDQYGLSTWTGVVTSDILGGWDYTNAVRQCAVTTTGELIAGANLYKLDVNGLSFNKTPLNTSNPSWVRLLYYNQTENQIELPEDIHVTNATIDNLSADKITSGTLRATTAITCAGTISTGNGAVVMGNTSLSTYDVSVPSAPVLQCSIGADGVITAGTTKISNSGLITYYNNAVSTVISNQGRVAIGGRGQQSISIDGGLIKFYGTGSTIATDGTVSGTLGAYITSDGTITGLAAGSVDTAQLVDDAITSAKIDAGAVVNEALATNAVDAQNIRDNAVTTTKIQDAAITNAKIGQAAIKEANIDNLAVSSGKIQDAAITNAKIGQAAVQEANIADLAVTDAKINTLSAGKIRTGELAVDVELKLTNTGSALLAGPAQTSGGTDYWKVRLDNNGLTTYTQGSTSTSVVPVCTIGADGNINGVKVEATNIKAGTLSSGVIYAGNISANQINAGTLDTSNVTVGTGSVVINSNGLTTYNTTLSTRPAQCSIGTDGVITAGGGAIKLDSTGLTTYDIVTTPSTPTQQCRVTTDGKFIAGNNLVTLSDTGLILGSNNDAGSMPTYISMNKESAITIFDTTVDPAVVIANTGSTFKNNVHFGSSINVSDRITLGTEGATINPATLAVTVSQRTNGTLYTASASYKSIVLSPSSEEPIKGILDSGGHFISSFGGLWPSVQGTFTAQDFTSTGTPNSFKSNIIDYVSQSNRQPFGMRYNSSKTTWPTWTYDFTRGGTSAGYPTYMAGLYTYPQASSEEKYIPVYLSQDYNGALYTVSYNSSTQQYSYKSGTGTTYTDNPLYSYDSSTSTYTAIPSDTALSSHITYFVKNHKLTVASKIIIDIPFDWYASYGGTLNETYSATVTYNTHTYSADYTPEEGISNVSIGADSTQVQQSATLIATPNVASGGLKFIRLECPNVVNYSEGKLNGNVIGEILSIQFTIKLPLDRSTLESLLEIRTIGIGAIGTYSGGELFVSSGGLWGTTVVPSLVTSGSTSSIALSNYGIAPIANTTYVKQYVSQYSTSSSTMGLKRVIVLPAGESLPTYGRDGDICIFVAR